MKKIIFVSMMLCAILSAKAQIREIADNAVQGTGTNQHKYVGAWAHNTTSYAFHNRTLSYSKAAGAYLLFTFTASKFEWYTEKKNTHGIVALSIDGGPETMIDLYSSPELHVVVFTSPVLTEGVIHVVRIRVTGTKNPASSNYYLIHDAFNVYTGLTPADNTNTYFGLEAMGSGVTGVSEDNSAFGHHALGGSLLGGEHSNTVQNSRLNTGIGAYALGSLQGSDGNTAIGCSAMSVLNQANNNTAVGFSTFSFMASPVGNGNTALGADAGSDNVLTENSTAVGCFARFTASNQVRFGFDNVTSIGGPVSWSTLSDGRFKRDIREDVSGLEFVNGLRPVSYTIDKTAARKFLAGSDSLSQHSSDGREKPTRQTGFVAQEVDALIKKSGYVFNGVQTPQNEKDPYTIRYAEFVVPLVKAVQELTAKVEEQQAKMEEQQKEIEALRKFGTSTNDMSSAAGMELYQNNPNPFSADTDIKMALPESAQQANIIVYTSEGKQIKDVTVKQRGRAAVTIQGNELNPGTYLYALIVDDKVIDTKRMILTK